MNFPLWRAGACEAAEVDAPARLLLRFSVYALDWECGGRFCNRPVNRQVANSSPPFPRASALMHHHGSIRPAKASDVPALVDMTHKTGVFRPVEVVALGEVLADYVKH